jgi:hypothetical protein
MKEKYAVFNYLKGAHDMADTEQEAIDLAFKNIYHFYKEYTHGIFYTKVLVDGDGNETWSTSNSVTDLPQDILDKLKSEVQ